MNIQPIRYTPYLNNTRRRQRIVNPNRAPSAQGQREGGQTQQRCCTQQSPNRAPSQGELRKLDIPTQPGVLQQNYQQLFLSTQIRRSPSFRLKNFHPTDNTRNSQSSTQEKRSNIVININKEERINRINILGDLLQQMESNTTQPQQTKQSLSTEMATVPKSKFDLPTTLMDFESNIEELHFFLVESQQKTKQQALVIEQSKMLN